MQHQLNREARWAVGLTLIYLLGWISLAYFSPAGRGLLGFPLWFELACIYLPIGFIGLVAWAVKVIYQPIDLEGKLDE